MNVSDEVRAKMVALNEVLLRAVREGYHVDCDLSRLRWSSFHPYHNCTVTRANEWKGWPTRALPYSDPWTGRQVVALPSNHPSPTYPACGIVRT